MEILVGENMFMTISLFLLTLPLIFSSKPSKLRPEPDTLLSLSLHHLLG